MTQGGFQVYLFEWLLLLKEKCNRFVKEKGSFMVPSFLDCKFLESRVPALVHCSVHPSIHLSVCVKRWAKNV